MFKLQFSEKITVFYLILRDVAPLTDKFYLFGGCLARDNPTSSCIEFDTLKRSWKEFASMNGARYDTACASFEGKIVVTGGCDHDNDFNTVEVYDHVTDSWSYMPSMIERRRCHKMVGRKNKFFAFLGFHNTNCEVYDSTCNKFVLLNLPSTYTEIYHGIAEVVSVGNKLVVFGTDLKQILFYDVENGVWSVEECDALKNRGEYRCVKLIQL